MDASGPNPCISPFLNQIITLPLGAPIALGDPGDFPKLDSMASPQRPFGQRGPRLMDLGDPILLS